MCRTLSRIARRDAALICGKHDIKFEEDNWSLRPLGGGDRGGRSCSNGLEVTQFTYFQQCGGVDLDPHLSRTHIRPGEAGALSCQDVDSIFESCGRVIRDGQGSEI